MQFWHPSTFQKKRANLESRAKIFATVRTYFDEQNFVEVDTPALQISPGLEPHLTAFATEYVTPRGEKHTLYLATSPEFSCKKLLTAGMEKIYQLGHVFRNAEGSSRHHPEFTLCEWYRVGAGYQELMNDAMALLRGACTISGRTECTYQNISCDPYAAPEILTVQDAFLKFTDIDLLATVDNAENPSPQKLFAEAKKLKIHVADDDRWDDIALRILGEKIEPHLGKDRATFLSDYPLCMAALARPKPENPNVAERFEMYVCGLELANAFVELTDAKIQRARFEADMDLKEARYGMRYPIDEDFLNALEFGMPQAAGIAMGFDRLVMLAVGADDIKDVLWAQIPVVE